MSLPQPISDRRYGYIRASTSKQVLSAETQKQIITDHYQRLGRTVDGWYIDQATSGKKDLHRREAGCRLVADVRRGDHVAVAKIDRLSRSLRDFANTLHLWDDMGITLHLCDVPFGSIDPQNRFSRMLIGILMVFAEFEREMIVARTNETHAYLKAQGLRNSRWPEYGYKWVKKDGKYHRMPNILEQEICLKALELREQGYSLDQIRQFLAYEWGVSSRGRVDGKPPGDFPKSRIPGLIKSGLIFRQQNQEGELDDSNEPDEPDEVV